MSKKKKRYLYLIIIVLFLVLCCSYYAKVSLPMLRTMATEEIKSEATEMIHYTNNSLQGCQFFFDDFFTVHRNKEGEIDALTANTGIINQLNMIATAELQKQVSTLRGKKIHLPMGAFTGSMFFAQFGHRVPLTIQSVGNSHSEFHSFFHSMGINQTLHRLVLFIFVEVEILIPLQSTKAYVRQEIIFAENIIVGKVPDTYLTEASTDYLDLLP